MALVGVITGLSPLADLGAHRARRGRAVARLLPGTNVSAQGTMDFYILIEIGGAVRAVAGNVQ